MALAERVRLIRKASPIEENDVVPKLIEAVLDELKSSGLVEGDDKLTLTLNGTAALREQAAHSSRLYAQFSSSLNSRSESKASNVDSAKRISRAVESFLKDCIDQRALGVAMVGAFGSRQQDYHIVAILQSLPDYMGQLSRDEAMFLTEIIQELLARPSEEERSYLGLALQARFSLNLIGQDPQLVATRMQELAKTLFLIDSTTLINLLARGCIGHNSAVFLMNRLKAVKAPCATTKLLVTEAAEHARWAIDHANGKAPLSSDMLLAATGRAGYSTNLFLDGYYTETASGSPTIGLFDYLDSVMGSPAGHTATDEVCEDRLEMLGIPASELENWKGFAPELWAEREKLRNEIAEVRIKKGTYTHERQTQAEAEALIIIENVRAGVFTLESDVKHAYFVSNTRILDKTTHQNTPITMRPAGVLQWLSTITTANADELASLTNSILWELCERGFQVVDTAMLQQTFNPLLSASREHLQEEVAKLNNLTAVEYGESAKKAFEAMSDLELPVALNSAFAQQTRLLEEQARKSSLAATAAQKSRLSEEERMEYDRLKGEKAAKRTRARGKSRSHRRKKKAGGRS
jgi:hypothetical protein